MIVNNNNIIRVQKSPRNVFRYPLLAWLLYSVIIGFNKDNSKYTYLVTQAIQLQCACNILYIGTNNVINYLLSIAIKLYRNMNKIRIFLFCNRYFNIM